MTESDLCLVQRDNGCANSVASLSSSTRQHADRAGPAREQVCYPAAAPLSPDDSKLFVACHRHAEVRVMSTDALGTVTNTIPTGDGPYLLRIDPHGKRLWVPNRNDQTYTVIDVASEQVVATRPASASHPHTFAFAPDGPCTCRWRAAQSYRARSTSSIHRRSDPRSIEVGLQGRGVGGLLPRASE